MKDKLIEIFKKSLQSVIPNNLFKSHIILNGDILKIFDTELNLSDYDSIKIISVGKAAYPMTKALIEILKDKPYKGISINLKHIKEPVKNIDVYYGSHPYPDKKSMDSANKIIEFIKNEIKKDDLVFFLISGGASALITLPVEGITLEEKKEFTKSVMNAGANIKELNTIRKHLSAIKGGKLAEMIFPAKLITIAISDVQDDDIEDIGSGPTVPDPSTFNDCIKILKKYSLIDKTPNKIMKYFERGVKGEIKESIKPYSKIFKNNKNYIIGNTYYALKKAESLFKKEGIKTVLLSSNDCGETKEVGKIYASIIKESVKTGNPFKPPVVYLTGGELTVNVKGTGKGGRNQELILSMLMELENLDNKFCILSGGTDGIDGPTDAAGAIVDSSIYNKIKKINLNPQDYLLNNDSYNFFKKTDSLIFTGPTDTNVRDIRFFYIGGKF